MGYHLASSCIILHHLASFCIILHHLASPCIILHHLASSCIIFHHHFYHHFHHHFHHHNQSPSVIVRHHEASVISHDKLKKIFHFHFLYLVALILRSEVVM